MGMIEGSALLTELLVALVGVFAGTMLALAVDRYNQQRRKHRQAEIILRSLAIEMGQNDEILLNVRPCYVDTPWGKSFYVSTVAWETAVSNGNLPEIIGFHLADAIQAHYSLLVQIRYYVDLMTKLWFAPSDIDGYDAIRAGFREALLNTMSQAIDYYPVVVEEIDAVQQLQRYREEPGEKRQRA